MCHRRETALAGNENAGDINSGAVVYGAGSLKPGPREQFTIFTSVVSLLQGGRKASLLCAI